MDWMMVATTAAVAAIPAAAMVILAVRPWIKTKVAASENKIDDTALMVIDSLIAALHASKPVHDFAVASPNKLDDAAVAVLDKVAEGITAQAAPAPAATPAV